MSRTHAEALALVNWRGVFYERYQLDRHVTALEGANGAGKTTVMIAAYIALLPDMSRLRFTNLGETGATGGDKGIWGRLGDPGRPSYVAIEFSLADSQRLIAGVHLERKGEPSVEPTPFIVWNLDKTVRLQDLLLVAQGYSEAVPELQELRENAVRLGGRLQSYATAREYWATLFDQGIMPLRLGTDEERNKFNEMLRTSMTGGISRVLTSDLRSFVLREESGLTDTLQRMRANLDACRRTRGEVQESRRLEQEIGGVFEAGQAMFAAAFLATRERADELSRRVAEAQAARDQAHRAQQAAQWALDQTLAALGALETRRSELTRALDSSRDWHAKMKAALDALRALQRCAAQLAQSEAEERDAEKRRSTADWRRIHSRDVRQRAQDDYARAAKGLADLQQGIEELHRRAGAYRQACRRLHEAKTQLQVKALAPSQLVAHLTAARMELDRIDSKRRELRTRLADADAHRERHAKVMAALKRLTGKDIATGSAHVAAIEALTLHRQQCALAERLPAIENDLNEARQQADRQQRALQLAHELGVELGDAPAAEIIGDLLASADEQKAAHDTAQTEAREALAGALRQRDVCAGRQRELLAREPLWREHAARALRLSAYLGMAVDDETSLDIARTQLSRQYAETTKAEEQARDSHERLVQEARDLLNASGPFPQALLQLKDRLGAELLAGNFEELAVEDAAILEARLGALAQALIVDDPASAAKALADRAQTLSDVLLVSRDADLRSLTEPCNSPQAGTQDVAVQEGVALRVSRIPDRPRLGRRARERQVAELRAQAEAKALELGTARSERRVQERLLNEGDALLAGQEIWLAANPADALAATREEMAAAEAGIEHYRAEVDRHAQAARDLAPRIEKVRKLLAEALLLDPPDHTARARTLTDEAARARHAKERTGTISEYVPLVEAGLPDLKDPPMSDEDMASLRLEVQEHQVQRSRLDAAIEALEYLCDNAQALGWESAQRRLDTEQRLAPALQEQLNEAQVLRTAAEDEAAQAQAAYDEANADFQSAERRHRDARQAHAAAEETFRGWTGPAPTEEALAATAAEIMRMDGELDSHGSQRDALLTAKGGQETELQTAQRNFSIAEEKVDAENREAEPARKRWEDLLDQARRGGLAGNLLTRTPEEFSDIRGHINFVQEAKTRRGILLERLRGARGAETLLAELELLRDTADAAFADGILGLWLTVRDWLHRRLPAQVAEVNDPREALMRLHDQLSDLEERLARQENELRGASEDVARGIEVQIRKARGQVNRLTKGLTAVSFGNIQSIQVRMLPDERMEQVLHALRDGAAQELLFQANMPIEEAFDEIFRRYGGGRSGGQRLLDYREYVHLQVEIRRKSGTVWESANPTRLSTGEAIGVGAALMMVVLTEWERDANLLRGKRTHGSLRFLFLDEANRLSADNLGVLFDLCQTLDLQLMIAAPEVARAAGNTTYHLVRRPTSDGREEVLVSGRRSRRTD